MVSIILLIFFVFLYQFSEGATEGYIWADAARRLMNPIIKGSASGNGLLDYHGWRFFENVGIIGAIFTYLKIAKYRFKIFAGSWLVGYFLYERILNFVVDGDIFKPEGYLFYIAGFEIPRYFWQDIALLIIGILLIAHGIYQYKKTT